MSRPFEVMCECPKCFADPGDECIGEEGDFAIVGMSGGYRVHVERGADGGDQLQQLHEALAGAEGELAGLRVSEAFFRSRCELLEAAVVRKLTEQESDKLKGCCPLCAVRYS